MQFGSDNLPIYNICIYVAMQHILLRILINRKIAKYFLIGTNSPVRQAKVVQLSATQYLPVLQPSYSR